MPHKSTALTASVESISSADKTSSVIYRCRCQNTVELFIWAEAVQCVKCGTRMRPQV